MSDRETGAGSLSYPQGEGWARVEHALGHGSFLYIPLSELRVSGMDTDADSLSYPQGEGWARVEHA